jgi:hypothetical protein
LGEDGIPFIVNMTGLKVNEAKISGRNVNWAAEVKWKEPLTLSESQRIALCCGFQSGSSEANVIY